jgi:hypothetical protein
VTFIDLDDLERKARAAAESWSEARFNPASGHQIGEADFTATLPGPVGIFTVNASPAVVLELIARLRAAELGERAVRNIRFPAQALEVLGWPDDDDAPAEDRADCSPDPVIREIPVALRGAVEALADPPKLTKRKSEFICPRCGSHYFGSSNCTGPGPMVRHCHGPHGNGGCGFTWPEADDRLHGLEPISAAEFGPEAEACSCDESLQLRAKLDRYERAEPNGAMEQLYRFLFDVAGCDLSNDTTEDAALIRRGRNAADEVHRWMVATERRALDAEKRVAELEAAAADARRTLDPLVRRMIDGGASATGLELASVRAAIDGLGVTSETEGANA